MNPKTPLFTAPLKFAQYLDDNIERLRSKFDREHYFDFKLGGWIKRKEIVAILKINNRIRTAVNET